MSEAIFANYQYFKRLWSFQSDWKDNLLKYWGMEKKGYLFFVRLLFCYILITLHDKVEPKNKTLFHKCLVHIVICDQTYGMIYKGI